MYFNDCFQCLFPCRWMVFVKHPHDHVRDAFSKVVVDLIFRKKWVNQKKLHSEEDFPLSQVDRRELVHSEPLLDTFNKQVMASMQHSLKARDASLQLTLMSTIRNIGQYVLNYYMFYRICFLVT